MKNGLYYLEVLVHHPYNGEEIATYFLFKTDFGIIVLDNKYSYVDVCENDIAFKKYMVYSYSDFDEYCHMVKL